MGLAVYITELDVDDSRLNPGSSDGMVAGVYKRYLGRVPGTGAVSSVLTWGVWDTPHYTAATPGQSGPMARRPLLFGADGTVKDASWATEHCFARTP
ncbi:endo-1,4-beta-xylanase [uncultured Sphingomonas sp.]|uniref:endo-1,4-beta-xylanase n=1 Tax=uncultured Sphingomonas sp. TaxID=158754 RepID=UPI00343330F5